MLINVSIKILKQFSQSVQEIEFLDEVNRTILSELKENSSLLNKLLPKLSLIKMESPLVN